MPGRPFPGCERVKRFVRGHMYYMKSAVRGPREPREQVVIFDALNDTSPAGSYYIFKLVLINTGEKYTKEDKSTVVVSTGIDTWYVREVQVEDLPVFMYMSAYPEFRRVLEGTSDLILKRKRRRKRVSALRKNSARGRSGRRLRLKEET